MSTNYIYTFAGDPGALVLTDGAYSSDGQRVVGNQPGIARADFINKALRQSSYMASVLAQFIVDRATVDVSDSNSVATGVANFIIALSLTTGFPSGTKVPFFQAAAPTYWTKETLNNDKALRVVSGSGGGSGGTHDLSTPPSIDHLHTGPSHYHTGGNHTLTVAEMPSHTHTTWAGGTRNATGDAANFPYSGSYTSGSAGGDGAHSHGNTSSDGTGNTSTATFTPFSPKYIDVIMCVKN